MWIYRTIVAYVHCIYSSSIVCAFIAQVFVCGYVSEVLHDCVFKALILHMYL